MTLLDRNKILRRRAIDFPILKIILLLIASFGFVPRMLGDVPTAINPINADLFGTNALAKQQAIYAEYAHAQAIQTGINAAHQTELTKIYSKDPWRRIGESTNPATGSDWVEFQGTIQETLPNGVVFKGKWGPVLSVHTDPNYDEHLLRSLESPATQDYQPEKVYGDDMFYVEDFPWGANPETGFEQMLALDGICYSKTRGDGSHFSYTNQSGKSVTIYRLVYGTPCQKIWSTAEINARKKMENVKTQSVQDRLLKSNQDLAEKGDAYGLLRMGERYRDGDGVPKNLMKAEDYLSKAAAAGSQTAAAELSKLKH